MLFDIYLHYYYHYHYYSFYSFLVNPSACFLLSLKNVHVDIVIIIIIHYHCRFLLIARPCSSIFFISTYFSDYILVPRRSKGHVAQALEQRGFTFEVSSDAFVNSSNPQYRTSPPSTATRQSPPSTPPPSTLSELQSRTFASLRKHNVHASVDRSLRIVQCAARYREPSTSTSPSILRPSLITALILDKPRFLSLTLTSTDPSASILLEERLLSRFTFEPTGPLFDPYAFNLVEEGCNLLLGSHDDILVPITLDLRDLPLEATGIICGVAGRLAAATQSRDSEDISMNTATATAKKNYDNSSNDDIPSLLVIESQQSKKPKKEPPQQNQQKYRLQADPDPSFTAPVEISFLSTARAGTVIVGEKELERAVDSLEAESRDHHGFISGE